MCQTCLKPRVTQRLPTPYNPWYNVGTPINIDHNGQKQLTRYAKHQHKPHLTRKWWFCTRRTNDVVHRGPTMAYTGGGPTRTTNNGPLLNSSG